MLLGTTKNAFQEPRYISSFKLSSLNRIVTENVRVLPWDFNSDQCNKLCASPMLIIHRIWY